MYSTVQMSSEPMIPIGMSFCGFLASCAAVLTASNPIYAKNTIAPPVNTPLQPNSPATGTPSLTVCGGMNGCQLAGFTAWAAKTMNTNTTATLMRTITLLTLADSRIPITRSVVTSAMMMTAGELKTAVTCGRLPGLTPLAEMVWSRASLTAFQPSWGVCIATVTAPSAYSRTRSHPMIHAISSPRVAYP